MKEELLSSHEKNFIICVDDEQAILNQLSVQLEEAFGEFCMIEYAESAEEALDLIEDIEKEGGYILLVISDQIMPGMHGDQFLEQINARFPDTRKILLTGYAGLESAMYAINRAGLDKYLEKPWNKDEFLTIVRQLVGTTIETKISQETFRVRDVIQNITIFRDLAPDAVNLIAEKLKLVKFPKDSIVFAIDDPGDCLYIIKSGEVKVIAGINDSDEVLAYLGRGNYFGEMALLTGEPRSASVMATMESDLLMLTKEEFDFLLTKHPSIAVHLSHVLSQRLRNISIKKAGRQNKIICSLNTIKGEHRKTIVFDIVRKLHKETNGKVIVIDLDFDEPHIATILNVKPDNTGAHWIIANLDSIQEDELAHILPEDHEGVKFFIPPVQDDQALEFDLIQVVSLFKEFYNFVLLNFRSDSELDNDMLRTMDQAHAILYLLEQTETSLEKDISLLQKIHRDHAALMKKVEIIVVRDTPIQSISEGLYRLVERHRIHYLRLDERAMHFLFPKEQAVTPEVLESNIPQINHDVSQIASLNREVSRIARRLGNVSVGLVLGGGGARAFAHLGILKVLQEEGIPIDIIAGTSMGAFIGALYILGKSVKEILEISRENWKKLNSPISWTLPRIAFIKGKRIDNIVHDTFGDVLIEDLPLPFFCVAGDLVGGQEVVIGRGKLYKAILATGALPGFFEPVPYRDMQLVDGGVVNNVPGDVLKKQGIDVVIAVDVTPEREVHLLPATDPLEVQHDQSILQRILRYGKQLKSRYGTILLPRIIMRVIAIEGLEITRNKARYFDIHIKPNLETFDLFDFKRLPEIVDIGEQTGRREIAKIRETINSLKR